MNSKTIQIRKAVMLKYLKCTCQIVASFTLASAYCFTQAQSIAPDAGALLQQMERGVQRTLPAPKAPVIPPPQELKSLNGVKVKVSGFKFSGNTLVSSEALTKSVEQWIGKENTFEDLQNATIAVANAYREKGWVVRSFLPEQDVSSGLITIHVVEAVLGKISIEKQGNVRISNEVIQNYVNKEQPIGAHISQLALDRSLLIVQDLGVASIDGNLAKGENDSETDLILSLAEKPMFEGLVSIDNYGSVSTGMLRENLSLRARSPLGIGDLSSLSYVHTQGSNYLRGEESVPVGYSGWQVGAYASVFDFNNIDSNFSALQLTGHSVSLGLFETYPILRSTDKNLFLRLTQDHKMIANQSLGTDTSNYKIDVATATLTGNAYDSYLEGGVNNASVSVFMGNVNLDGSPNQASDAAGPNVAGLYGKLLASISRLQQIDSSNGVYGSLSGQLASKNLDSSEQFYLGGPYAARAYPTAEGGVSQGYLLNLEYRHNFTPNVQLAAFYDYAQGTVNRNNDFAGAAIINSYHLQGAGLALTVNSFYGFSGSLTWSHRIGENPLLTTSGTDPDGTYQLNRIWLSVSHPFSF